MVSDGLKFQVDIGSAKNSNSPKHLVAVHQNRFRRDVSNKANNTSVSDNLDGRKYFIQIDGCRYPKDAVMINPAENDELDQYRDLNTFYKQYVE